MTLGTPLAQVVEAASLILWDEATMAHRHAFEALDRTLQDLMHVNLPFGGRVVVVGGDFRQILPVVRRASPAGIVSASLCRCAHAGYCMHALRPALHGVRCNASPPLRIGLTCGTTSNGCTSASTCVWSACAAPTQQQQLTVPPLAATCWMWERAACRRTLAPTASSCHGMCSLPATPRAT